MADDILRDAVTQATNTIVYVGDTCPYLSNEIGKFEFCRSFRKFPDYTWGYGRVHIFKTLTINIMLDPLPPKLVFQVINSVLYSEFPCALWR